ncbi:hypothetical protein Pelo_17496 [Pelomyxa schiedti]|nr:hypothetical protein Pelo_17496 [Pelomyxa schiedti]
MIVSVPVKWRQQKGLSEREIESQVLLAQVCGSNGTVGVQCFKCNKATGSVVEITRLTECARSSPGTFSPLERFVFGIKSICTSSAQHLRGPVVVSIAFTPDCIITTAPFNLHSRMKTGSLLEVKERKDRGPSPPRKERHPPKHSATQSTVSTSSGSTHSAPVSAPCSINHVACVPSVFVPSGRHTNGAHWKDSNGYHSTMCGKDSELQPHYANIHRYDTVGAAVNSLMLTLT